MSGQSVESNPLPQSVDRVSRSPTRTRLSACRIRPGTRSSCEWSSTTHQTVFETPTSTEFYQFVETLAFMANNFLHLQRSNIPNVGPIFNRFSRFILSERGLLLSFPATCYKTAKQSTKELSTNCTTFLQVFCFFSWGWYEIWTIVFINHVKLYHEQWQYFLFAFRVVYAVYGVA